MTTETGTTSYVKPERKVVYSKAASNPVYGLGFIGALVYYIQFADSFWIGVLGFLKAIVWPAMLVYEMLKNLSM